MEARMCFELLHGLTDISKFYPSLLARDNILFSDVLVASRILIGYKGTFKTSGKPSGDKINNRSHLCAFHLHCAQQTTHISQDDRKSIIALCDLCPKIHVFMIFL